MIKTLLVIGVYLIASMILLNYLFGLAEKTIIETRLVLTEFSVKQQCLREIAAAKAGGNAVYRNITSGCYG